MSDRKSQIFDGMGTTDFIIIVSKDDKYTYLLIS